jgi:hypothetical protein
LLGSYTLTNYTYVLYIFIVRWKESEITYKNTASVVCRYTLIKKNCILFAQNVFFYVYTVSGFWRNMLAIELQGEARQSEGSWNSWQEAWLLAKLVARLKSKGIRGD